MNHYRLLDLFCGAGGCSEGYRRAGFIVHGIDNRRQPRYPYTFTRADALEYLAANGHLYDVIHASPPCQRYSTLQNINKAQGYENEHPDLIDIARRLLIASGKPYVIENVQGSPLNTQVIVCAHSLGMKKLARHRHFESNVMLHAPRCTHRRKDVEIIGIYGERPDGHRVSPKQYKVTRTASSMTEAKELMQINWMEWHELKEAIPPAYTEYIGRQLIRYLENREAVHDGH